MKRKLLIGIGLLMAILTLWIAIIWVADAVRRSRVPVSLYPAMVMNHAGQLVVATGTWEIEGQNHATPLQTTRIYCEHELKRCTSATAAIESGEQMTVQLDFYDVADWTASHIVFTDDSPICVQYVYTIDLLTESVSGMRMRKTGPAAEDARCQNLEKQIRLRLRQGFDVWYAQSQDAMPWFGRMAIAPLKLFW